MSVVRFRPWPPSKLRISLVIPFWSDPLQFSGPLIDVEIDAAQRLESMMRRSMLHMRAE